MTRRRLISVVADVLLVVLAFAVELTVSRDGSLRVRGTSFAVPDIWFAVVTALVFLSLLRRWRHPVGVLAVQVGVGIAGAAAFPAFEPFTGIIVALYAVSRRHSATTARYALLACAAPFAINSYNTSVRSHGGVAAVLQSATLWILLACAVWGFGRVLQRAETAAQEALARQAAEAALLAQSERLRLARELHDSVANSVGAMLLQAAGAAVILDEHHRHLPTDRTRSDLAQALQAIENAGARALTELHHMLGLLRAPDSRATGDQRPGEGDLVALVEYFQAAGLRVDLTTSGLGSERDRRELGPTMYRVTQEALSNSAKHAGPTARVTVRVDWGERAVRVWVRDTADHDEAGHPPPARTVVSSGHGLRGMDERVRLVGGTLTTCHLTDGFEVVATLPASGAPAGPPPGFHAVPR